MSYYRKSPPLHSVEIKMVKAKFTLAQAIKAQISLSFQKRKATEIADKVTIVYKSLQGSKLLAKPPPPPKKKM